MLILSDIFYRINIIFSGIITTRDIRALALRITTHCMADCTLLFSSALQAVTEKNMYIWSSLCPKILYDKQK